MPRSGSARTHRSGSVWTHKSTTRVRLDPQASVAGPSGPNAGPHGLTTIRSGSARLSFLYRKEIERN